MAKEKTINPAQAARKAEKQRALKKSKAQLQAQRTEKLARRNPERLQREVDDLKSQEQSGNLRPHDRQRLAQLEKDVAAIKKAREALGDRAPKFGGGGGGEHRDERRDSRGGGVLGKRRRDGGKSRQGDGESSSETDEDARNIPMPKDTPPPIPRQDRHRKPQPGNANDTLMGQPRITHALPPKPVAKIVYEAAPQLRDLRKEATTGLVPTAVQNKLKLAEGKVQGRLLEPEELDKLEREGYRSTEKAAEVTRQEDGYGAMKKNVESVNIDFDAEEEALERELRQIEMEALREEGLKDAEKAVDAAVEEAKYSMMGAESLGKIKGITSEGEIAEKNLRHVQMEEVEDGDI
ncbi:hypothetical protein K432DRAFT_382772 [Lepidopterella palustris CBS 459.81]|uniref:Wbp11/ELF5/Saf1 N-terminal domain-containing protein n=1 Tax=Lepidopterella palustris CBS 459.81 TaxID=1314670 RepID=A0A8E2E9K9_9PEZI|nr:hypothetical protein K432DRAFT_382772 [Lepidopterella palustris CBS 459.81]